MSEMQPVVSQSPVQPSIKTGRNKDWVFNLLLVAVLLAGAYFRFLGVKWDDGTHLHPDERFLTMVETSLSPVNNLADFFNTQTSTLNPANRGYTFFVYGTLPIFIVRYVGEAIGQTGYDQIDIVGRELSATADLLTVLLVYLIGRRLYDRRVGLLAAAFASFSVLPIQLSHFFTVDTFTNFFGFLAVYFAVRIGQREGIRYQVSGIRSPEGADQVIDGAISLTQNVKIVGRSLLMQWGPYMLFGMALGMATASKINAAVLAILLPVVEISRVARIEREERKAQVIPAISNLVVAAVVSLIVFRICQPYAFSGPGFFGLKPDPNFVATMTELSNQSNGNVDFPPALQWARRPITFSLTNIVDWGMGLPLGLLVWAGFLWMAWRIARGHWKQHLMLWTWTGLYFAWQSLSFTSTMRYQMLVYPSLAIIGAWAVCALWDKSKERLPDLSQIRKAIWRRPGPVFWRMTAGILGGLVLIGTCAWAFAFTRIYSRTFTRVAASEWIYQNVPGPLTLKIDTSNGVYSQPIPYHAGAVFSSGRPFTMAFTGQQDGAVTEAAFPFIVDTDVQTVSSNKTLVVSLVAAANPGQSLGSGTLAGKFSGGTDPRGSNYLFTFDSPILIKTGQEYLLKAEETAGQGLIQLMGPIQLTVTNLGTQVYQSLPAPVQAITAAQPYTTVFSAFADGNLSEIDIPHLVDQSATPGPKTVKITIAASDASASAQGSTGTIFGEFPVGQDGRGSAFTLTLDKPLAVKKQALYVVTVSLESGAGSMAIYGSAPALESSWDDALPQPIEGYSPYDYYNGIYQGDLNFEMYWDDNPDKLKRFETTLDEADYLFISSNRQWATTVRVPERYPLTTAYYRALLGCPADKDIIWCYATAQPGMFTGTLGYKLVSVFQSNPAIGPFQINDQFAEEAFTVYDHPKVLIFEKDPNYNPQAVRTVLGAVDLSNVIHVTPRDAGSLPTPPKTLMLSSIQAALQQAGGTWTALFNWDAIVNKYQVVGVIIWYLTVAFLGLLSYPLVRMAFPGLADRGYPLARTCGLLLLSFIVWIAGSNGIPFTRLTISLVLLLLALVGGFLAVRQRKELAQEWRSKSRYFLMIEGLVLAFFLFDLLIRLGNPDLWHPYKGGEKPMDFSFLQAVIKSTTFPPYDPWFGGGYINYYYYGFVFVGVLVKWLGIVPEIAYNLILPTLFAMVALAAFSFGWNIAHRRPREPDLDSECVEGSDPQPARLISRDMQAESLEVPELEADVKPPQIESSKPHEYTVFGHSFKVGLASAIGLLILGNLGTVRMIWQGFQRLVAPGGNIDNASFFTHWIWSFEGFFKFLVGNALPYYHGDWYWIPSRAITTSGGNEITEFPMFTFLYADLHAHLIALGITILALTWALSILLGRAQSGDPERKSSLASLVLSIFFGALIIGSLRPMNTWDYPTYLVIGIIVLVYTLWRYFKPAPPEKRLGLSPLTQRVLVTAAGAGLLAGLSLLLFQPFSQWYGQAYDVIALWTGERTPFWSYLTQWGVFLFVIATWLAWETYDWMRNTPMTALVRLRPYQGLIGILAVLWLAIVIYLTLVQKVEIAWLALLLATWAAILIFRPGQPDTKRAILFMTGTGLILTLFVELFVLVGDIGRMNTIFKFYYQAWTLFALSAAAGLGWLLQSMPAWKFNWRLTWQTAAIFLVAGAALFPIAAGLDKIRDRMAAGVPLTLDGMAFMPYATYTDYNGATYDLAEDYDAIRWMQNNVKGSPIIVEGNTPEYRWGSRFTIYTGLPGVMGWNWHERQQRAILPDTIEFGRIADIATFYTTTDQQTALNFLQKYGVQYIIVGQLERAYYPGPGLDKFSQWNGSLWQQVYQVGSTIIYRSLVFPHGTP